MSNNLRVVHGGLDSIAHDLARGVAQVDERLERLTSELAPLRSDWTGDAQQAYHHAKAVWDQAMTEMRDLLAQTQAAVVRADADYRAADARGAAAFQV